MSRSARSKNKKIYMIFTILLLLFSITNISNIAAEEEMPDLIIDFVKLPNDEEIIEGKDLEFVVKIKNQGEINATDEIEVKLIIDDVVVSTNSSSVGLPAGSSIFINLSWTPTYADIGVHFLSIEVYYKGNSMYAWDKPDFEVLERPTDLKIINIDLPDSFAVNRTARIYASVKNSGKNSTNPIYVKLNSSEDGEVETVLKEDGLPRNETFVFSFNWTPSQFGSQKITVDVVHLDKTHDFDEISVVVGIGQLKWWDKNWHYRQFLAVTGNGNVSESFNFTEFLIDLDIFSQTFENNTIRIIEYDSEGNITGENNYYKFNESIGFEPVNNAIGTLIWNVTGSSEEKYYCIYFDVENNQGVRTELIETEYIIESGDADIGYFDLVEGWWIEVLQPINGSYSLINETIDIKVSTKAMAENVIVEFYLNNTKNYTKWLTNDENNVSWVGNYTFTIEGNWKIRVNSSDRAGYKPTMVEYNFYVGMPDVEIINITFLTNWPPTSPKIYNNDIVNITAHVIAHDANVENINVSLSIFDIKNTQVIHTDKTKVTIYEDENNSVSFDWMANISGDVKITITLDPDDLIEEQNESNNEKIVTITVNDWPDLEFENIILPSEDVTELDKVSIDVIVVNKGEGNATDYAIGLYIEPVSQGFMTYTDKVDSKLVSVKKNSSKTVRLYWDSAKIGEWYVGAKVLVNDTKRDPFGKNRFLSNETLKVKSIERNPPIISELRATPRGQEQGGSVTITAIVTDKDSGIESVTISIENPKKVLVVDKYNMIRTVNDEFKYVFDDTLEVGKYTYEIEAIDISFYKNNASATGDFFINKDSHFPVISYFDARPYVQLINGYVNITCIATDNIGIESARAIIVPSEGVSYERTMKWSPKGKYVYNHIYNESGGYNFSVLVKDKAGNWVETDQKYFWVTSNIEDADDDGMPDWWEKKYGLNPEDPTDAEGDLDGDGFTNLKEYKAGTNPSKDIFAENAAFRIKDNVWYLAASIVLFLLMLILSFFGKRGRFK